MNQKKKNNVAWFEKHRPKYVDLTAKTIKFITDVLDEQKMNYAIVDGRTKTVASYANKLDTVKYSRDRMKDLTGVRIVGYVKSDVKKIEKIIRSHFTIDESETKDKSKELKPDQFGYRGIHFIGTFSNNRKNLTEYRKFSGMRIEIQIKTILEHTWAQIEHDRNYKYKTIPEDLQRGFSQTAGLLEVADEMFETISKSIDSTDKEFKRKTKSKKLKTIKISPLSVKIFLIETYSNKIKFDPKYGSDGTGKNEIKEILDLGNNTLGQFKKTIKPNLDKIIKSVEDDDITSLNLSSLILIILLLHHGKKYYKVLKTTREHISKDGFDDTVKKYEKFIRKSK